jgi:acyl-coenzyme A synthetase/AMP-(fatty) acid ligase
MKEMYEEFIKLVKMEDNENKAKAMKNFFEKLKAIKINEFNWADEVFEGLHVANNGSKTALYWVDLDSGEEKKFSYEKFANISNKFVNFLRDNGVKKGDYFHFMLPLIPEVWFSHYVTVKGGFVGVPHANILRERDLEYRFKVCPPSAVIADENSAEVIDRALEMAKAEPLVKVVVGDKEGWEPFDSIKTEHKKCDGAKTKANDPIFCFFTSGTTGLPKGVLHTATSYPVGHLATASIINIQPDDIHNNLSAAGWAKFAWSSFFSPFIVGATVLCLHFTKFKPEKYLEAIESYGVNTFCAPPTAWRMFMLVDVKGLKFENLRDVVSAGEPLNPEIFHRWKEWTGTEIRDFYGQTESTAMIGNPPWFKGGKIVPGSFGVPTFMYDITLLDDDGNEIKEPKKVGHIVVRLNKWRPIGLLRGYIGNARGDAFIGDYYFTGDKAYFDENGYWWFVARADDVIKTSDYRVGPFEVESVLLEHPAVAEVAVIGSPDPIRWQIVKAFVVLKPSYKPSRELALELFKHCKNVLAKFKIPRIIEFVDSLPKTISGKIKRKELRLQEEERKKKGEKGEYEYFYSEFPELKEVI